MTKKSIYILVIVIVLIVGCLYVFDRILMGQGLSLTTFMTGEQPAQTASTTNAVQAEINTAYHMLYQQSSLPNGSDILLSALQTFDTVAANTSNTDSERVQALNGINYAYTMSNFDANSLYQVVFSNPPFSQYYIAPSASTTDPLHPESGDKVEAVENALVQINELSNALIPNHYAITRMETADIFAYQRAVARGQGATSTLATEYADKIKTLASAYDALPPLASEHYAMPMQLQIMFAHASALAFVGENEKDQTYLNEGENLFQQTIALGDASSSLPNASPSILDETSLARIFYASYFWQNYKTSDPSKIETMLEPLITNPAVKLTDVYTGYLPSHSTATVAPFTRLRLIALQMPQLKTFLEGLGWKFSK